MWSIYFHASFSAFIGDSFLQCLVHNMTTTCKSLTPKYHNFFVKLGTTVIVQSASDPPLSRGGQHGSTCPLSFTRPGVSVWQELLTKINNWPSSTSHLCSVRGRERPLRPCCILTVKDIEVMCFSQGKVIVKSGNLKCDLQWSPCQSSYKLKNKSSAAYSLAL